MGWFKRSSEGIKTETKDKKETPEGLWYKCPTCKTVVSTEEHKATLFVCVKCDHHERLSAEDYFNIIFDKEKYIFAVIKSRKKRFEKKEFKNHVERNLKRKIAV